MQRAEEKEGDAQSISSNSSNSSSSSSSSDSSSASMNSGDSLSIVEADEETPLMKDLDTVEGMDFKLTKIDETSLMSTDEEEKHNPDHDNPEYVKSLLQEEEVTEPEINLERKKLRTQALQRRLTQEDKNKNREERPQDPRRQAKRGRQDQERKEQDTENCEKTTTTEDLRTHVMVNYSAVAQRRPAGKRPVTSIKVRYIQIEPMDPVPGYNTTRVYNLAPAQEMANVVNKMRDNCYELEREAYNNYMFRQQESGTKAMFSMRTQGILESKSITITTMFEADNADGYVSATEARMDSSTVHADCDAKARTRQITAVVYYTGEFKKFPQAEAAINRLQQLEKLFEATGKKPAEALARLLNNIPDTDSEDKKEERKKITAPEEPPQRQERRDNNRDEYYHNREDYNQRETRQYRPTYYDTQTRHARTPYDQRERRRY